MFTESGFGGVEGTVRPGIFPRELRVVLAEGVYADMYFDARGLATFTYEAISNLAELAGLKTFDQDDVIVLTPQTQNEDVKDEN